MEETPEHIIDIHKVENLLKNGKYSSVSEYLEEKLTKEEKILNSKVVNLVMKELDEIRNLLPQYKPKGKNPFSFRKIDYAQILLNIEYYKKRLSEEA